MALELKRMTQIKSFIFWVLGLALLSSCSRKNIAGIYYSNFAMEGFFVTKLMLSSDSTFGYRMHGDLLSDTANGHYSIKQKLLRLKYNAPVLGDGGYLKISQQDSVLIKPLVVGDAGPRKYSIGYNKLFAIDSLGKKLSKRRGFSRHKKYLLWGDFYMTQRRYFLKRIKS